MLTSSTFGLCSSGGIISSLFFIISIRIYAIICILNN